jgi:hypothetical protein
MLEAVRVRLPVDVTVPVLVQACDGVLVGDAVSVDVPTAGARLGWERSGALVDKTEGACEQVP